MLTADLVRARKRGDRLVLPALKARDRPRAEALAGDLLTLTRGAVGETRGALREAWSSLEHTARERMMVRGFCKLLEDGCTFESAEGLDPVALRDRVFALAAQRRREAVDGGDAFDPHAVLAQVAHDEALAAEPDALSRAMWSDLKQEQRLVETSLPADGAALVERWLDGRAQAVLLRATRVVLTIEDPDGRDADAIRALFRAMKFRRLLYRIEQLREPGTGGASARWRVTIDGPSALFGPTTRYGLGLALLLPAVRACRRWQLQADVRWGKRREALRFELDAAEHPQPARRERPPISDDVAKLRASLRDKVGDRWKVRLGGALLSLPGVGLVVPDLQLRRDDGVTVHVEVLGYWSREAVWRRVELVEKGLSGRVVFVFSERLRVSPEVLDEALPGALVRYKGVISARQVLQAAEAVADR